MQTCIDGAGPGDTIEIVTNTLIDETLTIEDSLTLTAGHGFHPELGSTDPTSAVELKVEDDAGSAVAVTLSGLRLLNVLLEVDFDHQPGDGFTLEHSSIEQDTDGNNQTAVYVTDLQPGGTAQILDNAITSTGQPLQYYSDMAHATDVDSFTATGNTLASAIPADSYHGMTIDLGGVGTSTFTAYSNVIHDAMECDCGGGGAIDVRTETGVHGVANIVGNTIDHTPVGMSPGIHISAPDVGSSLTANIFDNLITHSSGGAIQLPPVSSSLVVNNGFNDLFGGPASEFGGYAKGPGTVSVSPRYVNAAAADYQLRPHSPVLGKGEICTPGGLSRSDAAGKYRITGRSLDLGAYELGAGGVPKGSNIFGTAGSDRLKGTGGDDIICGFGGRDTIKAAGGNDLVYGGPGNDRIFGGAGADQLIGGTGHDLLDGGSGADYLNSRDGHRGDTDKGGPGHDHCVADRGDHVSSCP